VLALLVGVRTAHAYFLDDARRFDVRARIYSQVSVATEETTEKPPDISPGDILSQRNFYNPEFDANLSDFMQWTGAEEFKFRFAWWGFYDGIYDYLDEKWAAGNPQLAISHTKNVYNSFKRL